MNKLLQISGGFVYSTGGKTVKLDVEPRREILVDLIQSASHKVLVFCPFRHMVAGLHELLGDPKDADYIDHAIIHGDVPDGQRNDIFDKFQNTDTYKAIIAHPGCMSHGLTLTAADTIIWYCPMPSFETYEQANARIRRIGQRHRQQIIHLQGTPVERKIYALLRKKASAQDMLLAMFEDATTLAQQVQPTEKNDVTPRANVFE
jgi:SNF2 family DNA or RNA helicase